MPGHKLLLEGITVHLHLSDRPHCIGSRHARERCIRINVCRGSVPGLPAYPRHEDTSRFQMQVHQIISNPTLEVTVDSDDIELNGGEVE